MHEIYAAFSMIKIPQPEGPREKRDAEEKFYADACAPQFYLRISRAFRKMKSFWKSLKRDGQQRGNCASCNQAQAEREDEVVVSSAGNGDGAGAISGRVHERLPTKNITVQCRVTASSETSCSNSRCAGIEVSMTRAS